MRLQFLIWACLCNLLAAEPLLIGPPDADARNFGTSLAANGDQLFIGNPWSNPDDKDFCGTVHFCSKTAPKLLEKISGPTIRGAQFGRTIVSKGDYLFIGATGQDNGVEDSDQGCVYAFKREGSTWDLKQTIKATGAKIASGQQFGIALAFDGTTLVISSKGPTQDRKGAVYLYQLGDDEFWELKQKVTPPSLAKGDYFGTSVHIDGDELIVGVPGDKTQGWLNGKVYVFRKTEAGTFESSQMIFPRRDTGGMKFGLSLAKVGGYLAISQPGFTEAGKKEACGAVSIFKKNEQDEWSFSHRIQNPLAPSNSQFGYHLVCKDESLLISAPYQNGNDTATGAVFRYHLPSRSLEDISPKAPRNPKARLGYALTTWGDHWVSNFWNDEFQVIASEITKTPKD